MAKIEPGFNAKDVPPNDDFSPIPAGSYLAILVESEEVATKNGEGSYRNLEFQIVEGEFKGRKLWERLNLKNKNPEAVRIAWGALAELCRAVNVLTPSDTLQLHNLPVVLKVKLAKRKDTGEMTNRIAGYLNKAEAAAASASAASQPAGKGAAPWKKAA